MDDHAMKRYRAFLSYNHADARLAGRLHKRIEQFTLPKRLREGRVKRPCAPIFRDREEMSSSTLTAGIADALTRSDRLLVLCTPDSATRGWVNREVEEYLKIAGPSQVTAMIAGGSKTTSIEEHLPPALLVLRQSGQLDVVDLRASGEGFEAGSRSLIARLSGIDADALRHLDIMRRRRRLALVSSGVVISTAGMALALVAALYFFAGWVNAVRLTYFSLGVVQRYGGQVIDMSYLPGPGARVSRQVLSNVEARLKAFSDMPGMRFVPGGEDHMRVARAKINMELARLFSASGQYADALEHARASRHYMDELLANRDPLVEFVQERLAGPNPRGRSNRWLKTAADRDTWLTLARIQSFTYQRADMQASIEAALAASASVLRFPESIDLDRISDLEVREMKAEQEGRRAGDRAAQAAAFASLRAAIDALPDEGEFDCCTPPLAQWKNTRAMWRARVRVLEFRVAQWRKDYDLARELYVPALEELRRYETLSGDRLTAVLFEGILNDGYVDVAQRQDEIRASLVTAERLLPQISAFSERSGDNVGLRLELSAQLQTAAMARARLHEGDYRTPLTQALAISGAMAQGDAENLTFAATHALTLGYAAKVLAAAGQCEEAAVAQRDAIQRAEAIRALDPTSPSRQRDVQTVSEALKGC
jgi:hypothetical protein